MKLGRLVIRIEVLGKKAPEMIDNPRDDIGSGHWSLHKCPDKSECRIGAGGCAGGWCSHFRVEPDAHDGTPRYIKE